MHTQRVMLLDGAMGTMLQGAGLRLGERPETLSITAPKVVEDIHRRYVQAGSELILANTFCANAHKLAGTGYAVEEVVTASVQVALSACAGTNARVALDVGPIGELLEPLGTLRFDEAYARAGGTGMLRAACVRVDDVRGLGPHVSRLPRGRRRDDALRAGRDGSGRQLLAGAP